MDELQLFRGDTVLLKGKKRKETVSLKIMSCYHFSIYAFLCEMISLSQILFAM